MNCFLLKFINGREKYNMKKSKKMVIAVIALFLLSGFIDLTPNYTVEELDDILVQADCNISIFSGYYFCLSFKHNLSALSE